MYTPSHSSKCKLTHTLLWEDLLLHFVAERVAGIFQCLSVEDTWREGKIMVMNMIINLEKLHN